MEDTMEHIIDDRIKLVDDRVTQAIDRIKFLSDYVTARFDITNDKLDILLRDMQSQPAGITEYVPPSMKPLPPLPETTCEVIGGPGVINE